MNDNSSQVSPASAATVRFRNRLRYGVAAAITVGAAGTVAWAQLEPNLDSQRRFLVTAPTAAGSVVLLALWLWITAAWSWRTRLLGLALFAVAGGLASLAVRVDGVSGDVVPHFSWRFSPKHDETLAGEFANLTGGQAELTADSPADYPQFLGPRRRAVVPGPKLDRDWKTHPPREVWRRDIGAGWGSFAIVGNYAFTQEQRGENELVVCYELLTGKPVWDHADPGRYETAISGIGPRATPTVDGGRVYTVGAMGQFNCLDAATGKRLWEHKLLEENDALLPDGTMQLNWGNACSPLVVGNLVIVAPGGPNGRSLVAYDKLSGEEAWHAGDDRPNYSSPHLATLAGKEQIVCFNQYSITGHDPADGHVLWRQEWDGYESKCTQPLIVDDFMVVVSAGYGLGSSTVRVTRDAEGEFHAEPVWTARNVKNLKSKFSNMILHDGFIYALDDGVLAAIEVTSGQRRWRAGRYGHGQLLLVGNLLLVQTEDGELVLVAPSPKRLEELGRIQALQAMSWNNPAISGRHLLVRNHKEAVCYELAVEENAARGNGPAATVVSPEDAPAKPASGKAKDKD